MLYLLNILLWIFPLFLYRGILLIFLSIIVFIFSQSYWVYPILIDIYELPYYAVVPEYIDVVLLYSIYSALVFHLTIYYFLKACRLKRFTLKLNVSYNLKNSFLFILCVRFFVLALIIFSFYDLLNYVGVGDRRYYIENVTTFLSYIIFPLVLLLMILLTYDFFFLKVNKFFYITFDFLLIIFFIVLLGFDGSRREALPIIFLLFTYSLALSLSAYTTNLNRKIGSFSILFVFLAILLLTVFSLNRSSLVGWNYIFEAEIDAIFTGVVIFILSPMSTLHVNTLMLEYTQINGFQGVSNYLGAIGNFFFPKFIFGTYLFGEPLVLKLHDELGWYGFDFGFMAEAIYSGGLPFVLITHFIISLYIGFLLRGLMQSDNKFYFILFSVFILFGLVNSLRSDFMNLLKASLYLPLFISFIYFLFTKLVKRIK